MIYSLYHWLTDTHMDDNSWPWYVDVAGGIMDMLVLVGVILLITSMTAAGPAVAADVNNSTINETAPYYVNQTTIGNQSTWIPSNVTLDSIGQVASRFGPYVIGSGEQIPGGTTYAGSILLGTIMMAVFVGSVFYTGIGAAGGVVVASVAGYGLIELGLAPPWLKIVLLLIIGLAASVAALRVTN